ncbi:MAG: PilX N-terminal domain-containing pilus assembly protein [Methylovulum sp.]|nr:PilX N-terminal domain-containing pilus assembly protein [Methylovulum sp.]
MLNPHIFFNHHKLFVCFNVGNDTRQSGAVMVVSLIMLLLLTLIGITGAQVTGLEEKMVGNSKEEMAAFQAAESILRAGEAATAFPPAFTCAATGGYKDNTTTAGCQQPAYWQGVNWSDINAKQTYSVGNLSGDYIIEQLDPVVGINDDNILEAGASMDDQSAGGSTTTAWYRITARGTGNNNAIVTLQSTYTR